MESIIDTAVRFQNRGKSKILNVDHLRHVLLHICVCVSSAGSMKEAVTSWVDRSPSWVADSPNRPVALFRSALTPPDGVEKHCIV